VYVDHNLRSGRWDSNRCRTLNRVARAVLSNICNVQELPALATVKPCKKPAPLLSRFVALFVKLVYCIAYFFGIFTDLLASRLRRHPVDVG